MSFMRSCRKIL